MTDGRRLPLVSEIEAHGRFQCDVLRAELTTRGCIMRQVATVPGGKNDHAGAANRPQYPACAACGEGKAMHQRLGEPPPLPPLGSPAKPPSRSALPVQSMPPNPSPRRAPAPDDVVSQVPRKRGRPRKSPLAADAPRAPTVPVARPHADPPTDPVDDPEGDEAEPHEPEQPAEQAPSERAEPGPTPPLTAEAEAELDPVPAEPEAQPAPETPSQEEQRTGPGYGLSPAREQLLRDTLRATLEANPKATGSKIMRAIFEAFEAKGLKPPSSVTVNTRRKEMGLPMPRRSVAMTLAKTAMIPLTPSDHDLPMRLAAWLEACPLKLPAEQLQQVRMLGQAVCELARRQDQLGRMLQALCSADLLDPVLTEDLLQRMLIRAALPPEENPLT